MSDSEKIVSLKKVRNNKKSSEDKVSKRQEAVYCSFCNRPNTEVVKMVQGPGVNICSECTMIAVQYLILQDRLPSEAARRILDIFWKEIR